METVLKRNGYALTSDTYIHLQDMYNSMTLFLSLLIIDQKLLQRAQR